MIRKSAAQWNNFSVYAVVIVSLILAFSKPWTIRSFSLLKVLWASISHCAWMGLRMEVRRSGLMVLSSFPLSRSFWTIVAYHLVKHSRSTRLNTALKVRSRGSCTASWHKGVFDVMFIQCLQNWITAMCSEDIKNCQSTMIGLQTKRLFSGLNVRSNNYLYIVMHGFFSARMTVGMPNILTCWEVHQRVTSGCFPSINELRRQQWTRQSTGK